MTIEVVRKKLNDDLAGDHPDQYNDIVEFLSSKNYREVKTFPHSDEVRSQDSIFVRNDLELNFPWTIWLKRT